MSITKITKNAFPASIDLSSVDLTIGNNEIVTANIADTNVTHAKLHTDMDLSSKTVTLPSGATLGSSTNGLFNIQGGSSTSPQIRFFDGGTARARIGVPTGQTYLSLSGSDTLTADVVIRSDGNVGIGTTSLSFDLELHRSSSPTFRIEETTNTVRLDLRANSDHTLIRTTTNHDMRFNTNQVDRMTIENGGNVGIGTIAPANTLHVEKSVSGDWLGRFRNTHTTNGYGLLVYAGDDSSVQSFKVANHAGSGDYLVVRGDGNVGIGTDSPSAKLHLYGTSGNQYIRAEATANTSRSALITLGKQSDGTVVQGFFGSVGDANQVEVATVSNHTIKFYTNNSPSGDNLVYGSNPRLWLTTPTGINGLRVYGDTTPFEFQINSGSYSGAKFTMGSTGDLSLIAVNTSGSDTYNDSPNLFLNATRWNGSANVTSFQGAIRSHARSATNADGYLGIGANANADALVIDASTGDVGIGLTDPGNALTIARDPGDSRVTLLSLKVTDNDYGNGTGYNHASSIVFDMPSYESGTRSYRTAAMITGGKDGIADWWTGSASTNFQGALRFHTRQDDVLTEQMRIDADGNVGIGTTNPAAKLDVRSSEDPTDGTLLFLRNNVGSGNGAFIRYDVNNVGDWAIGIPDNRNAFTIWKDQGNTGTEYFTLDDSGRMSSKQTGWMGPVFAWWTAGRSGTDDYITIAKNGGILNLRDYGPGRGSTRTNYNSIFHGGFLQKWDDEGVLSGSWTEARIWIYGSVANDTHDQRTVDLDVAKYHYSTNWQSTAVATIDSEIDPDRGGRWFVSTFFNTSDGSNASDVPGFGIRNNRTDYDFDVGGIWIQFRG